MPSIIPVRRNVLRRVSGTTTFNPANKSTHITLSGGNLVSTSGAGSTNGTDAFSVASRSTGKCYAEFTLTSGSAGAVGVGVVNAAFVADAGVFLGSGTNSVSFYNDGNNYGAAAGFTQGTNGNGAYTTGDVISMAVDVGAGLIWWRKNGGSWFSAVLAGDPAAGTNGNNISALGTPIRAAVEGTVNGNIWTANFGGSAYGFSVPSGYGNW